MTDQAQERTAPGPGDSTATALRALEAEMRASVPPDPVGVVYTWDVVSAMTVKAWADRLAALSTRSEPTGEPETRVDTPADAER